MNKFKSLLFISLLYVGLAQSSAWWPFGGKPTENSQYNFDDVAPVPNETSLQNKTLWERIKAYNPFYTSETSTPDTDMPDANDDMIIEEVITDEIPNNTVRLNNSALQTLKTIIMTASNGDGNILRYAFGAQQNLINGHVELARQALEDGLRFIEAAQNDGISQYNEFIPAFEDVLNQLS